MKIKINILLVLLISTLLFSCEDDGYADFDPGQTNTQEVSGEWYVRAYDASGAPEGSYHLWSTYNTAENNEFIWLDGHDATVGLKSKVEANVSELSFAGPANAPELYTEGRTVTVSNGQIIKNGGRAAGSGTVVDSIYFQVEISEEPGVIYTFGGHRRTGFGEDDL